jgi:hypothetical protein
VSRFGTQEQIILVARRKNEENALTPFIENRPSVAHYPVDVIEFLSALASCWDLATKRNKKVCATTKRYPN